MLQQRVLQNTARSALVLAILSLCLAGCKPSLESSDPAERARAVAAITDQAALATVAVEDNDADVRRAAVTNLTDQGLLAKASVEGKDWEVRQAAVLKLTDQALLAKVAVEGNEADVRQAAVEKLTDQALLAKVAVWGKGADVRQSAVAKLTDQALLAKVAHEGMDTVVCRAAFEKLTDQGWLVGLAMGNRNWELRRAAVEKLTDQAALAKVAGVVVEAMEDKDSNTQPALLHMVDGEDKAAVVRQSAVEKLTDQALLAKVAVLDWDWGVRRSAVAKLTNQALLAKVAVEGNDAEVRRSTVAKLTDQTALAKVAVEGKDWDVGRAAVAKLTDQEELKRLASAPRAVAREAAVVGISDDAFVLKLAQGKEPSPTVRAALVRALHDKQSLVQAAKTAYFRDVREGVLARLAVGEVPADVRQCQEDIVREVATIDGSNDSTVLVEQAIQGRFDVICQAAARRLRGTEDLKAVALAAIDRDVLKIVLRALDDTEALKQVAQKATDAPMRLAAARKSGTQSWDDIFGGGSEDPLALGDALAAVSLFDSVQSDAKDAVQQACLRMIQKGDESRIPEMVDLLGLYGDIKLCEDYLNCGQPDLENSGTQWAHARGYDVGRGQGSNRARWGSQ